MNTKTKKIMEKAVEMIIMSEKDELIYGDSYLQFNEMGMTVIDPQNVTLKFKDKDINPKEGLNTLKGIKGDKPFTPERDLELGFVKDSPVIQDYDKALRKEAIKWIKWMRTQKENWRGQIYTFKLFFDLKEEDLL